MLSVLVLKPFNATSWGLSLEHQVLVLIALDEDRGFANVKSYVSILIYRSYHTRIFLP